jgi:hypothetical protein
MPAEFLYVSQQCAAFVIRHANARTTGIREANALRLCFTASRYALVLRQARRAYISKVDDELRRENFVRQLIRQEKCCSVAL